MAKDGGAADPLRNPRFQEPSVWQLFRESLFGKPRLLDCIQVEVTSVCPGRCVYCPHTTQAGYWRSRHMEAATFARLWPLMQESGRVHLQGWGEPFLHPRFMDFAALARKAGCRVSTTTCGLRMDETLAGQIVGSGIDIVAFSLVGTDEAKKKDFRSDITEGKRTLVVVHALQNAAPEARERLVEILSSKERDPEVLAEAVAIMEETGSIDYARTFAEDLTLNATARLAGALPPSQYRDLLVSMADWFVNRLK